MRIEQAKQLTPFELELIEQLRRIVRALEDLKSDD